MLFLCALRQYSCWSHGLEIAALISYPAPLDRYSWDGAAALPPHQSLAAVLSMYLGLWSSRNKHSGSKINDAQLVASVSPAAFSSNVWNSCLVSKQLPSLSTWLTGHLCCCHLSGCWYRHLSYLTSSVCRVSVLWKKQEQPHLSHT